MQCLDEMICFQRNFDEIVPGCRGNARSSMDYCIMPPPPMEKPIEKPIEPLFTMSPTAAATMGATEMIVALQTVGDAVDKMPLGVCQGDCDKDGKNALQIRSVYF